MGLELPEPRLDRLARSPLKLVVCQVRYTKAPAAAKYPAGQAVEQALAGPLHWRLNQIENRTIALGPEMLAANAIESQSGWRLTSEPSGWSATVLPDSASLETTRYQDWPEFSQRLVLLLHAVRDAIHPEALGRVGLRYVDRIEDPRVASSTQWEQWIQPEVLGVVRLAGLEPGIVAMQQQFEVIDGGGLKATIRHGFSRDEESGDLPYTMDFDTYFEGMRAFDLDALAAEIERLHTFSLQLFQRMITEALYNHLRG